MGRKKRRVHSSIVTFRMEELENKISVLKKQIRVIEDAQCLLEDELEELKERKSSADSLIPDELILSLH